MAVSLPYFFSQLGRHDDSLCGRPLGGRRRKGRPQRPTPKIILRIAAPFGSLCARSGQAQRLKSCPSRLFLPIVLPVCSSRLFSRSLFRSDGLRPGWTAEASVPTCGFRYFGHHPTRGRSGTIARDVAEIL